MDLNYLNILNAAIITNLTQANAINTFEPRVILKDIGLQVSPINPNKLNIVVVYSITTTGFTDSLSISLERTR